MTELKTRDESTDHIDVVRTTNMDARVLFPTTNALIFYDKKIILARKYVTRRPCLPWKGRLEDMDKQPARAQ